VSGYDFETHGFSYSVKASDELMTAGQFYNFRLRSMNILGFSDFSDILRVGLGSLPSKPS